MRRLIAVILTGLATIAIVSGQPAASLPIETLLKERLAIPAADFARFTNGEAIAWNVPGNAPNEIAASGAIRTKGDARRLVAWLRDIETFVKSAGTANVGAISAPAQATDFERINFDDVDLADLASCRPGKCEFRMPASAIVQFQKNVDWKAADAKAQAAALARTLIRDYVTAYQTGGDAALGAHHDQKAPKAVADSFRDMLRRSTKVWDLAYPFASYLETFPAAPPAGTESRFYWTRDKVGSSPALTLHHVVIQQFPDGRALIADKQFYASRQLDTALMIALALPNADFTSMDLVVSLKGRADAVSGVAGRLLRGRIEREMTEQLRVYLRWIRDSMAL